MLLKSSIRNPLFKLALTALLIAAPILCQSCRMSDANNRQKELFYNAVSAYKVSDYEKSIEYNEKIAAYGYESAALYYNLGNSYLKKNDLGRALLNYERAKLYDPRDPTILSNYRYARSLLKQREPVSQNNFIIRELSRYFDLLTMKEAVFVTGAVVYATVALFLLCLSFRRIFVLYKLVLGVLFALIIFITPVLYTKYADLNDLAIIVGSVVDAKYEPQEDSQTHFPLYAGMRVHMLKNRGEWFKVKALDSKIGWVQYSAVEKMNKR